MATPDSPVVASVSFDVVEVTDWGAKSTEGGK
jgi:hypothetical protein